MPLLLQGRPSLQKVLGIQSFIRQVNAMSQLADLDDKERAYVGLPEPGPVEAATAAATGRAARARLHRDADRRDHVRDFLRVLLHRVSTLLACPPEQKFERMASGPFRWLLALAMP